MLSMWKGCEKLVHDVMDSLCAQTQTYTHHLNFAYAGVNNQAVSTHFIHTNNTRTDKQSTTLKPQLTATASDLHTQSTTTMTTTTIFINTFSNGGERTFS